MAESVVLQGKNRQERRRRQVTRLREQGYTPAIVYGHGETPTPVAVPNDDLSRIVRSGERVFDLTTEDGTQKVQLKDLQWDYLGKELLHADFKRISADERIQIAVPVHLHGTAPGATTGGGVLEQPLASLNLECLAVNAPTQIEVNINELQLEEAVHVRDLDLPEGVVVLDDPEQVVVQVIPKVEEDMAAEGEEGATAEPEVIGRAEEEETDAE